MDVGKVLKLTKELVTQKLDKMLPLFKPLPKEYLIGELVTYAFKELT